MAAALNRECVSRSKARSPDEFGWQGLGHHAGDSSYRGLPFLCMRAAPS